MKFCMDGTPLQNIPVLNVQNATYSSITRRVRKVKIHHV